jgi:hypothetical protein
VPSKRSPTQSTRRDAKPPAGPEIVWVPHGHGRTRRSGGRSGRIVRVGPVDPRFLAPASGCWCVVGGVDRGWSLRSTPGYPLGPRWGRLWCGAGGQQASGGPRGQPFSQPGPAGRVGPTTTSAGPTGQPFLALPARFVERLARWAGRCGGGSHQGLRPWLGERLALWAERRTVRTSKGRTSKGTGTSPSTRGRLTVLRSCVPGKRSPTQITRRGVSP